MTEKKLIRVATPPSQGAMEPIRLETARWYKKLREEHPAILGRVHQFMAGDILVHQGETVDGPMAFLVVEGMLAEKQTHFTVGQGHVSMTMYHVHPGSVAFVQALSPQFAERPSFTTVQAESDGEALLIDREGISGLGPYGFLIDAELRLRRQLLESLWHQKLAHAVDDGVKALVREVHAEDPRIQTPEDLLGKIRLWLKERPALEEELTAVSVRTSNMKTVYQRELTEIRRLTRTVEGLETALKLAKMEANELRRISPVTALEEERRLFTLRSLGTELYLDRLRREWVRAGLDTHLLDFTEDESRLLMAEEPDGLAEIVQRVRSANQWDDDEIDAAVQLGVPPSRSTPPSPRNDVDDLLTFAAETDASPVPTAKTRPHISTLGFEDVDLATMRVEAAKPLISPDGIASFDLEGGLPRVETPYRAPMRTLDYSEEKPDGSPEEDPEIMILSDDDLLTLEED